MADRYDFTIPILTPTANELLRLHWRKRGKLLKDVAWYIRTNAVPPAAPFANARVTIHRNVTSNYHGKLDADGEKMIAKLILDALQPLSRSHPMGLGFIAGDGPGQLSLSVLQLRSDKKGTRIIVEDATC